jgi:dTDP-4-amino-4,6-dideoxy-D-galactose acyltransferase
MAQGLSAPCSLLEWDSGFFGFRVAQVCGDALSTTSGQTILEWSHAHAIRGLYFLADASSPETANSAHELGFKMVDLRIQFGLDRKRRDIVTDTKVKLRTASASDVSALERIARSAHQDSRFFFDSNFPRTRVEDLFAVWIAIDCGGRADKAFVIDGEDGEPVGYITCNLNKDSNTGRISLVGVAHEARGKGFGRALVSGALEWFWSVGVEKVAVVTQARNVAAQRLYQAMGFRTDEVKVWYHRWF